MEAISRVNSRKKDRRNPDHPANAQMGTVMTEDIRQQTRRTVVVEETRVAGLGNDDNLYGVTSIRTSGGHGMGYRRKPCDTCPWRKDSQVGRFPAQAFRESAHTAYDADMGTFACHEAGVDKPAACAGFLLVNADNNLGVRLAAASGRYDPDKVANPDSVPLYDSYRDMAVANGVDNDDPVLQRCRGNKE